MCVCVVITCNPFSTWLLPLALPPNPHRGCLATGWSEPHDDGSLENRGWRWWRTPGNQLTLHYTEITSGGERVRVYRIDLWPLLSRFFCSRVFTVSSGQSEKGSLRNIFPIPLKFYWTLPKTSACSSGCFHQCVQTAMALLVCVCVVEGVGL